MTSAYFGSPRGLVSGCKTNPCHLDTVEVWGSSPHGPTILFNNLAETLIRVRKGITKNPAQLELCLLTRPEAIQRCSVNQLGCTAIQTLTDGPILSR